MEPRLCDVCREPYIAKRLNSRFCSATCRKRNQRKPVGSPAATPLPTVALGVGSVASITRAELEAAGRLGTSLGQVALLLAARLDAQVRESGMGVAAIVREHRAALAEALKGAAVAADPVDELRARRDRKRAG